MKKLICHITLLPALLGAWNVSLGQDARPNILLILSDDHARQALSCYGNTDIETPALDRIAREGIRFEHALTPNSFCTPARAAVLTGKYSHRNGVTHLNQEFDGSQQTFPKLMQAAGYETSLFGKWHLLSRPTGFDYFCVQKMQGSPWNPTVFEPEHEWISWKTDREKAFEGGRKLTGYNNDVITDEALTWLKNRETQKPFCMLLHPKPPHAPYDPPKKYADFLKDVEIPEPATLLDDYRGRTPEAIAEKMTANRIILGPSFQNHRAQLEKENPNITRDELTRAMYQEYIKGYYRLVKSVDDNVGRVLDYLDQSGQADNTLIIYTSDQGFSLGEHGFFNKQWMYENPLHQPLLMRLPGTIQAGTVHESMVNHVDLAPTILAMAGEPVPGDMQGHSLKPILEGKAEKVREASYYHFYSHGTRLPEMIGIRTKTHKLIHYPEMKKPYQWELFDLQKDPEEMDNLYRRKSHHAIAEGLKKQLRELITELGDPVEAPGLMTAKAAAKPSILLIMADDMGYECVGANGGAPYQTPALDQLAQTGVRFEHCYSQPICTPSRVQIMTGIYNVRNYVDFGILDRSQTTFAHLLKKAGYATCIAGKWQLGRQVDAPRHFGFDESCLWQHTRGARDEQQRDTRYPNPRLEINGKPVNFTNGEYGPDVVSDFLCDFIERKKDEPFLAYYPMILPHSPFVPTPDSKDPNSTDNTKNFVDMVQHIDKIVGKLTAKLDEVGIRDNTLILFTADNGTAKAIQSRLNGRPIRGGKGDMTDAGTHVPLIANWPGTIPGGRTLNDLVDFSDILPTLCDTAGFAAPADLEIDGRSFLPRLKGEEGTLREWIYCWYSRGGGPDAEEWVRTQRYKLYRTGRFFDVTSDRLEANPLQALTEEQRAVRTRLQAVLNEYRGARL